MAKKLGRVGKYNAFKAASTLMTIGAPLITLACQPDSFIHNSGAAISATGIFTLIICALFLKDKLAEKLKVPSAFIISAALFVFIILVERIIQPMKIVCLVSMITSGIDELTFKRFYKSLELLLPKQAGAYKVAGFIFTTTAKLEKEVNKSSGDVNDEEEQS